MIKIAKRLPYVGIGLIAMGAACLVCGIVLLFFSDGTSEWLVSIIVIFVTATFLFGLALFDYLRAPIIPILFNQETKELYIKKQRKVTYSPEYLPADASKYYIVPLKDVVSTGSFMPEKKDLGGLGCLFFGLGYLLIKDINLGCYVTINFKFNNQKASIKVQGMNNSDKAVEKINAIKYPNGLPEYAKPFKPF